MLLTTLSKFKCPILCSILLILFLGLTFLNAQIIYTDIVPDFTSENMGDYYDLDIDNDGTTDFHLESINSAELIWVESIANGVNAIRAVGGPFEPYFIPLDENTVIAYPQEYYDAYGYLVLGLCTNLPFYCSYDWENITDKYLGLRILINGQTHYGWARLDVADTSKWTIKDYAYQATPNTTILAGQMPTLGVEDEDQEVNIKIVTSPNTLSIYNLNDAHHFTLFSMTGQSVLSGSVSKDNNMINNSVLSSGLYVIELTSSQTKQAIKKKVII